MEKPSFKSLFKLALREKFGTEENIDVLEKRLSHLREGKPISYEDLKAMEDESIWPFKKFWSWPPAEEIIKKLVYTGELFIRLNEDYLENEKPVISSLNRIFKNISLVSIILRFVYPEHYGIYSPPVLYITGIERGKNEVEDYLNYLNVLREIKDILEIREKYQVERVADVDMLLLALSQLGGDYLDEFNNLYWKALRPEKHYLIELTSEFFKQVENYDNSTKARLFEAIYNLSKNPDVYVGDTIKRLKGDKPNLWRYRLANLRLIYQTDKQRKMVKLLLFGKREDIYKKAEKMLRK